MAETIKEHSAINMYEMDQSKYAIVVDRRRALPEVRDGLKPVQRRVVYGAFFDGLNSPSKKDKSSALVGLVMRRLHAHGDCIRGNTKLYLLNGNCVTIKELFDNGIPYVEILSVDANTGKAVPAIAHSFRIGQYSKLNYHIVLSNGEELVCTGNHPIMLPNGSYIKAENIVPYTRIMMKAFKYDKSKTILKDEKHNEFEDISKIIDNKLPLTVESYYTVNSNSIVDKDKIKYMIEMYKYEFPFIEDIWTEEVDDEPMYDFTVDGYNNMMIPMGNTLNSPFGTQLGSVVPMMCIHNSSIYETITCLCAWYKTKYPLFYGKGNWGNVSGSGAAAMRYTECSLSNFGYDIMVEELSQASNIVDWIPNYKRDSKEPEFLPVKIPILLINGSFGIGVGMTVSIPSHNLVEVLEATRALMKNPNQEVVLVPDLIQSCELIDTDWRTISNTGRGSFKARGKIITETDKKGNYILRIISLPEMVNTTSVYEKILSMVEAKQLPMIKDIFNSLDKDGRPNIIIKLKPGADPNYVKQVIYSKTDAQRSVLVNFEAVSENGIDIKRYSYREYLLSFIDQRMNIKFRLYCNKLQKAMTRYHELDAYIKVLESGEIDTIINLIRKQKTTDDGPIIEHIIKKAHVTDVQAKFIINADLRKLSAGYLSKYKEERKNLDTVIKQYYAAVKDDGTIIKNEIDKELLDIEKKYGTPRMCNVISSAEENMIPAGTFKIVITENNYIRKIPDGERIGVVRKDNPKFILSVDNRDNILLFDNKGKVFNLPVSSVPISDRTSVGTDIRILIKNLTSDIIYVLYEPILSNIIKSGNKHYLTILTKSNTIKKLDLDDFLNVNKSGLMYSKIRDDDEVVGVALTAHNLDVVVCSGKKALRFPLTEVPLYKRSATGSKAMNTDEDITNLSVIYPNASDIIVVTKNGKIGRFNISMLEPKSRGKKGINVSKLDSSDEIFGVYAANENDIIKVITTDGVEEVLVSTIKQKTPVAPPQKVTLLKGVVIRCDIIKG